MTRVRIGRDNRLIVNAGADRVERRFFGAPVAPVGNYSTETGALAQLFRIFSFWMSVSLGFVLIVVA
jgi:hypothetical protein